MTTIPKVPSAPRKPLCPPWLLRMLRPAPVPLDWTRTVAALVGMGLPQLVGLMVGRVDEAVIVSMGALCATFSDVTSSYRYRIRRVGLTVLTGGFGFAVGALATGPVRVGLVAVTVAALSVVFSEWGDLWGAAGAQMLTFCIVATGHAVTSLPVTTQIGYFVAGELLLLAFVATTWPFRRTAPARAAVARVFDAAPLLFEASGSGVLPARHALTTALNQAHDLLISGISVSRSRVHDRLYVVLSRAAGVVEASVALAHAGVRPPEHAGAALAEIARCVRAGDLPAPYVPTGSADASVRALEQAIAELVADWRRTKLADPRVAGPGREPRVRVRIGLGNAALGRAGLLRLSRMVLCVAVAEVVGSALGFEQSYWIAMTVALVLKPNSGSVFARIVLRALGTVLGVVVAALLLAVMPDGWWVVAATLVFAALIPEALVRNYGLFTMMVTAVVLLKMSHTDLFGPQLPVVRLVDSVLGCAIALVLGYLVWPAGRRDGLRTRFADAMDTVAEYVALSLAGESDGRSALRRRTYRELSGLRAALQQNLMEPGGVGRDAEQWWPLVIVLERVVDGATERAMRGGGADEISLQHTQRIVSMMRMAARQLRRSTEVPPRSVRARLENVYADVVS
ncbi:FUSC family protein [Parasphingorhabdus pacifica]